MSNSNTQEESSSSTVAIFGCRLFLVRNTQERAFEEPVHDVSSDLVNMSKAKLHGNLGRETAQGYLTSELVMIPDSMSLDIPITAVAWTSFKS
jgi:hypothetical protein